MEMRKNLILSSTPINILIIINKHIAIVHIWNVNNAI